MKGTARRLQQGELRKSGRDIAEDQAAASQGWLQPLTCSTSPTPPPLVAETAAAPPLVAETAAAPPYPCSTTPTTTLYSHPSTTLEMTSTSTKSGQQAALIFL